MTNDTKTQAIAAVREALESCTIAKDRGMQWLHYDRAKVAKGITALAALEASLPTKGGSPNQAIAEGCATKPIIGNVRERWEELGYNDPDQVAERFRGDHWKSFYAGWIEGRFPLMAGKEEPAALRAVLEKARTIARQYHAGVQVSADTWKDLDALIKAADADL